MAILYGEPGKWAKTQAEKRLNAVIFIICALSVAYGVAIGIAATRTGLIASLIGYVVGLALLWFGTWVVNRPVREIGKERIKHWRGAQVESYVAWMIRQDLGNQWHLFNGLKLEANWDIDHVLIGPGGIFVISTKSCRGCFTLANGQILLNGRPCEFVPQAMNQALDIRKRLEAFLGSETPFVQPILAAPFGYTDFPERSQSVWILHQENLTDTFENESPKGRLDNKQIKKLNSIMQMLAASAIYNT